MHVMDIVWEKEISTSSELISIFCVGFVFPTARVEVDKQKAIIIEMGEISINTVRGGRERESMKWNSLRVGSCIK